MDQPYLDFARENITNEQAIAEVEKFIKVGQQGWADPIFLAALERVVELSKLNECLEEVVLRANKLYDIAQKDANDPYGL